MSELIKHECGIALIRLRKPLDYYHQKYGTWMYGINKLYLLMEKQHNRGQDGAGVVSLKLNTEPGVKYLNRVRSVDDMPIKHVFDQIRSSVHKAQQAEGAKIDDIQWLKNNVPFASELYLGHLRYGTFGRNNIDNVHPVMRQNNWQSRNLVMAGNFNLTNVDELFKELVSLGQHPKDYSDTVTILENVGHFLDEENQALFNLYKSRGYSQKETTPMIESNIDIQSVLRESSKNWDGGYTIAGMLGHGDAFVMRDPAGIRPAYYYYDDEIVIAASERAVIKTVINTASENIKAINAGHALIIRKDGDISEKPVRDTSEKRSCSFERIYFSRGSDKLIYQERKKLGELIVPQVMEAINNDIDNAVFSFIPNTAESAFYGMQAELNNLLNEWKKKQIIALNGKCDDEKELSNILYKQVRVEKIAIKDAKLRTFISADEGREHLVEHVYDVTYGTVRKGTDSLVIIDDSIVRGTTLKESILRILDRLGPKRLVVVSSSPQIRYPDCYGIDMANLDKFIAFRAAIQLLKDRNEQAVIDEVYNKCLSQQDKPKEEIVNYVKEIYAPFSDEEISDKIGEMLRPAELKAELKIIFQTIDNLHIACPHDRGDWYFTGNYPTAGGNKVVNRAFINYIEGVKGRAY